MIKNTFILGFSFEQDKIVEYQTEAEAEELAEDWCLVEGIDLDEAIKNYETSYYNWKQLNN